MSEETTFEIVLKKTKAKADTLQSRLEQLIKYTEFKDREHQMSAAFAVTESAEKLALLARSLPAYTGNPNADIIVANILKSEIPVDIGFSKEGWFVLRIPLLLPKKDYGSTEYVRAFLYPAMRDFFIGKPPVRYRDAVLIYRHIYDKNRPERKMRDHDNIEINIVTDIVSLYILPSDNPFVCTHYYCSAMGESERTEVYVVPKSEFVIWLESEKNIPNEGVYLYENLEKNR